MLFLSQTSNLVFCERFLFQNCRWSLYFPQGQKAIIWTVLTYRPIYPPIQNKVLGLPYLFPLTPSFSKKDVYFLCHKISWCILKFGAVIFFKLLHLCYIRFQFIFLVAWFRSWRDVHIYLQIPFCSIEIKGLRRGGLLDLLFRKGNYPNVEHLDPQKLYF
jgi:hypothetical protein